MNTHQFQRVRLAISARVLGEFFHDIHDDECFFFDKTHIIHLSYFCRYHAKGNCSSDCEVALDHRQIDDRKLEEIVEWCTSVLPKAGKVKIGGTGDNSVINRCYAKDKFIKFYRRIPQLQKYATHPVPKSYFGDVKMCLGEFQLYKCHQK